MIRLRGGIKVPTRRLELMAELRSMNDYIFWNNDALPEQASDFVQTLEISLSKYFKWANVHSINKLVYQATSNANVIPLPDFAAYSSNFYQNRLFQVLTFQIGFDFRYHTRYYAPTYMPATGQFHTQNIRKIGNYPFFDAFVNFQLKRARIYVKLDHATQGLFGNDYFLTTGYPANPRSIKFGISWNFYN
jgi:outer membrane cobalamin receptor